MHKADVSYNEFNDIYVLHKCESLIAQLDLNELAILCFRLLPTTGSLSKHDLRSITISLICSYIQD